MVCLLGSPLSMLTPSKAKATVATLATTVVMAIHLATDSSEQPHVQPAQSFWWSGRAIANHGM